MSIFEAISSIFMAMMLILGLISLVVQIIDTIFNKRK